MSDERCNIYFAADERDTEIARLRAELERLRTAICIGRPTIEALAKHGKCEFDAGNNLIAASDLFHSDPYARAESAERKLAMAVEASKAIIHILKPAKGEAHGQLDGVPDSHLFELVWARDDDGPQDYPCVTAGQLRRFVTALTELEKSDD